MKNNDSSSRVLLAIVVSFAFIVGYSYFMAPKQNIPAAQTQATQDATKASDTTNPPIPQEKQQVAPQPKIAHKHDLIATIQNDLIEVEIDDLGRISQVYLKDEKYIAPKDEGIFTYLGRLFGIYKKPEPISKLPLLSSNAVLPLELRFADQVINQKAANTPYKLENKEIEGDVTKLTLVQNLGEVVVKKFITFYTNDNLRYELKIELNKPLNYYLSNGQRPIADDDGYAFHGVVLKQNGLDGTIEKIEDGDAKVGGEDFDIVPFVSSSDRYFTSILFTRDVRGFRVQVLGDSIKKQPIPYILLDSNIELEGYIGAKDYKYLTKIYDPLSDAIEYGIITFFAKPVFLLLAWLYNICGNWGWAIVLLTLIVRLILFPLSYKGIMSMQRLKDLAPKMKELQTQYKNDPQKLQMHMMNLYKKHGANPLGGCLPMLLQIPVFFAIYRVLYNAVELKNADWIFWINDLSVMDPYLVLPILMGASMYVQQALTPNTLDPMQARIFKLLPIIFTIFLITFPAGLVLYWTINNIFSIALQLFINRVLDKRKAREIAEHREAHKHHKKDKK